MITVGVESLDALSSPPEWVNRLESSSEISEEDVSSSSITLVGEGSMALIKGRVYVLTGVENRSSDDVRRLAYQPP